MIHENIDMVTIAILHDNDSRCLLRPFCWWGHINELISYLQVLEQVWRDHDQDDRFHATPALRISRTIGRCRGNRSHVPTDLRYGLIAQGWIMDARSHFRLRVICNPPADRQYYVVYYTSWK